MKDSALGRVGYQFAAHWQKVGWLMSLLSAKLHVSESNVNQHKDSETSLPAVSYTITSSVHAFVQT